MGCAAPEALLTPRSRNQASSAAARSSSASSTTRCARMKGRAQMRLPKPRMSVTSMGGEIARSRGDAMGPPPPRRRWMPPPAGLPRPRWKGI